MKIQILGRALLSEGGSKHFSRSQEVIRIGKGDQDNPKMPVGQFLPHEVKCKIQDGAVVVTVLFGSLCNRKDQVLTLQQHTGDQVFIIIDEFLGQAIGIAELNCVVTPTKEESPDLHRRLTKMGYVSEPEVH